MHMVVSIFMVIVAVIDKIFLVRREVMWIKEWDDECILKTMFEESVLFVKILSVYWNTKRCSETKW